MKPPISTRSPVSTHHQSRRIRSCGKNLVAARAFAQRVHGSDVVEVARGAVVVVDEKTLAPDAAREVLPTCRQIHDRIISDDRRATVILTPGSQRCLTIILQRKTTPLDLGAVRRLAPVVVAADFFPVRVGQLDRWILHCALNISLLERWADRTHHYARSSILTAGDEATDEDVISSFSKPACANVRHDRVRV